MKPYLLLVLCCALLATGCGNLPQSSPAAPVSATGAVTAPPLPAGADTPAPAETPTPGGPITLRLWVPPQFDPMAGTPAANLLRQRLEEFSERRPGLRLDVRVKAIDGPGGLYESLAATTAAAQLAMPDLAALPYPLIQSAAVKGLLRPMNGLTNLMDDSDWYDYARQMAVLQNSIFGLPFAGDALVQVHRPLEGSQPALNWETLLTAQRPLSFPAADPQALVTLAFYQAADGEIMDERGAPLLEAEPLEEVLSLYQAGEAGEILPYWLTQFSSDEQAWETFSDGSAGAAITWLGRALQQAPADSLLAHIPTPAGNPFTLAKGWAWTLTAGDPEKRQLAVELAEYLSESSFLSRWTEAAGVLPTRPSALAGWKDSSRSPQLEALAASARLHPSTQLLDSLGPALEAAAVQVLKRQLTPAEAASAAVRELEALP